MSQGAVFVDRDDTLAPNVPYCSHPDDFELFDGVPEAIAQLNEAELPVIVITNQSGVARGYFTEQTLSEIHAKLERLLAEHDAHVDAIYHCPHHPDDGCSCRKPEPGMLLQAAEEHGIDLTESVMVGDRLHDVAIARKVGALAVRIDQGKPDPEAAELDVEADLTVRHLGEAVGWIIERLR